MVIEGRAIRNWFDYALSLPSKLAALAAKKEKGKEKNAPKAEDGEYAKPEPRPPRKRRRK